MNEIEYRINKCFIDLDNSDVAVIHWDALSGHSVIEKNLAGASLGLAGASEHPSSAGATRSQGVSSWGETNLAGASEYLDSTDCMLTELNDTTKELKKKLIANNPSLKKLTRSQHRRNKILIDSCASKSLVSNIELLQMQHGVTLPTGKHFVTGIVAGSRSSLSAKAPIISPFDDIEAYFHDSGNDNILSLDDLEAVFDVTFAGSVKYQNRRMVCKHRTKDLTFSCWKDPYEKNFYVYDWNDEQRALKTDTDMVAAQKLGLSRVRALRVLEVDALHKALSHAGVSALKNIIKEKTIDGLNLDTVDVDNWHSFLNCNACIIGKMVREDNAIDPNAPLPVTSAIGELVHIDCFAIGTSRTDGKPLHLVLTIDDYSGLQHTIVVNKADAVTIATTLKTVADEYEKQKHKIVRFKRDSGGALPNVDAMLGKYGIECFPSSVGRHVRVAERAIRHTKDLFRTLIYDLPYLLPVDLFPSAIKYITQSINLTPNANNQYRAPLHLFNDEFPRFHDHLRSSFGMLVATYNLTDPNDRKDDFPRADIGVIVGRDPQRPGNFLVQDLRTKVIKPRHDVTPIGWNNNLLRRFYEIYGKEKGTAGKIYFVHNDITIAEPIDVTDKRNIFERDIRLPDYDDEIEDIMANLTIDESDRDIYHEILDEFHIVALNTSVKSAREIYGDEVTYKAALKELNAMYHHKVWEYVALDEVNIDYKSAISSQMFLKEKFNAANDFEELKARIIGHGNRQVVDKSSGGTSSPTVAMTTVMAGLSIAAKNKDLELAVFDVKNAYLNAPLKDPNGQLMFLSAEVADMMIRNDNELIKYIRSDGRILVRLRKALYGLKTAGRDWFENVKNTLLRFEYKQADSDPCLFLGNDIKIFIYVDDFLTIGKSNAIDKFRDKITGVYGKLKEKRGKQLSYLGLNITRRDSGDITIDQTGYIENLLREYRIDSDTSKYPATSNLMHLSDDRSTVEEEDYLSLVMKIMFVATRTRPDILFATVVLATRSKNHLKTDYDRLIKVLKYLNGSRRKGLRYKSSGAIKLRMFVDAGFQTHQDAKGHTGFVIFPDSSSAGVLFKCLKQRSVSQSSAEAELISLHEAVTYLNWVSSIYDDLGFHCQPIPVYEDNKSTIMMSIDKQVGFKGRSKFIDRKFFGVYQHVENGSIELLYIGTEEQIADFFTKVIIGEKFNTLRYSIMGCNDEYDYENI